MILPLGRLLRLSLAPSAAADAAAGLLFGASLWPGGQAPWLLILGSLSVYHGGMALNDWVDREHDASTRADRPIPSGALSARFALTLALVLLAIGPLLAYVASPRAGVGLGLVALLAATYDLIGRGAVLGPLLLGLCRAGNLGTGIVLGLELTGTAATPGVFVAPLVYGAYVFTLSCLARFEDAEAGHIDATGPVYRRPGFLVGIAGLLLAILPGAAAFHTLGKWPLLPHLLSIAGALGLVRLMHREEPWTPPEVMRAMGMGLRRLLIATAALALASGAAEGPAVAGAILLGYPVSFVLRKPFPPS